MENGLSSVGVVMKTAPQRATCQEAIVDSDNANN